MYLYYKNKYQNKSKNNEYFSKQFYFQDFF